MSKHQPSGISKIKRTAAALLVVLALPLLAWSLSGDWRQSRADGLSVQADAAWESQERSRALGLLVTASYLHKDTGRLLELAGRQVEAGQAERALSTLSRVNKREQNDRYWLLLAMALLEEDRSDEAREAIRRTSGKEAEELVGLIEENDPVRAAMGLYDLRLPRSTERVLEAQDDLSTTGVILLAAIRLSYIDRDTAKLDDTRDILEAASRRDPGNITLRQLLEQLYLRLGEEARAEAEAERIEALQAGRP